ncbi:MAG: Ig-like domain-containing protein [Paludibacteraceae bacterium]|nr:Ig-like domain-containing protein [Paludibacteraceae bacterium]
MKKTLLVVITTLVALLALTATAERRIWLYSHDGNHVSLPVEKLDSISFEEPGSIVLNPEKKLLDCSGGRFSLSITANKPWTATVSDPTALTISKTSGTGNDNISVLAQSNADEKSYTSFVKFTLSDGTCGYLYVTVDGIVKSVSLDKSNMNIMVGGSESLIATTDPAGSQVTWSSSNNSVATVSNGVVTAVSEGNAVITAKSGNKSAECAVEVYSTRIPIPDVQGEAGKYTIAFRAPETSCINDIKIYMFGYFQGNNPEDENAPVATKIEQTGFDNWYKVVFESEDATQARGKICPASIDGNKSWKHEGKYELLKGDAEIVDEFGTKNSIVCDEESLGDVVYVDVVGWAYDPCVAANPAGTANFTVSFDIPETADLSETIVYVEGMGAGKYWVELGELLYDDRSESFTGAFDVPAGCFYKYVISYKGGNRIYMKGENLPMPYALIADDFVNEWDNDPWVEPISGGVGTFSVTFTGECLPSAQLGDKVFIAGNFEDTPVWERVYEMTQAGEGEPWSYVDLTYPDGFQFKFVVKYNGSEEELWVSADNIQFDEMTYDFEFEGPCPSNYIREKCKASDYPQVTIGTQVWMAENYRCSKYDTQSEAYKEGRYIVPTATGFTNTPYYTDASDKSKWNVTDYDDCSGNLTYAQIKKLGYLYNWAAVVGVADGQKQTIAFSGNRQGICPNGWHVPSMGEWQTLVDYIEQTDGKGTDTAGKHLKTTFGWYSGGNGLDSYGFAALPAGYAYGSSVSYVGFGTVFWSTTLEKNLSDYAYGCGLYCSDGNLIGTTYNKSSGLSVRCLKD